MEDEDDFSSDKEWGKIFWKRFWDLIEVGFSVES